MSRYMHIPNVNVSVNSQLYMAMSMGAHLHHTEVRWSVHHGRRHSLGGILDCINGDRELSKHTTWAFCVLSCLTVDMMGAAVPSSCRINLPAKLLCTLGLGPRRSHFSLKLLLPKRFLTATGKEINMEKTTRHTLNISNLFFNYILIKLRKNNKCILCWIVMKISNHNLNLFMDLNYRGCSFQLCLNSFGAYGIFLYN